MIKALDEIKERVNEAMEEGIEAEELTDILFERYNGCRVRIETKDLKKIKGKEGEI